MTSAQQIQQMYIAYYGRPADPAGLAYWTQQAEEQGMDWVTEAFTQGTEATLIQGNKSQPQLINDWYEQAFGRGANQREINEISKKMNDGVSQGQILKELLAQAESNPADKHTLENRTKVADNFTQQVEKTGASYTFNEVAAANSLLLAISPSSNASDIANAIQALISNVQPGRPLADAINKAKEEAGIDNSSGSDGEHGSGDNEQDFITVRDLLSFNDTTRAYDINLTKYNENVFLNSVPEGRFQASAFLDGTNYFSTPYNLPTPSSQHFLNLMGDWSGDTSFYIKESLLANFPGVKGGQGALVMVDLGAGTINVPTKIGDDFEGSLQLVANGDQTFSGNLGSANLSIFKPINITSATLTVTAEAVLGAGASLQASPGTTINLAAVDFEALKTANVTLQLSGYGTFIFANDVNPETLAAVFPYLDSAWGDFELKKVNGEPIVVEVTPPPVDPVSFSATETSELVVDEEAQPATFTATANELVATSAVAEDTVDLEVTVAGTAHTITFVASVSDGVTTWAVQGDIPAALGEGATATLTGDLGASTAVVNGARGVEFSITGFDATNVNGITEAQAIDPAVVAQSDDNAVTEESKQLVTFDLSAANLEEEAADYTFILTLKRDDEDDLVLTTTLEDFDGNATTLATALKDATWDGGNLPEGFALTTHEDKLFLDYAVSNQATSNDVFTASLVGVVAPAAEEVVGG